MAVRSRPLYSTSALQVAQYVFTRSAAEPTNLYLDGADLGADLPAGRLLLMPLRDLLLRPAVSLHTRDVVWRELIRRAREDHSSWLVAAIGMAMPGLRRAVRQLGTSWRSDRDDLESAVAEGFVSALRKVDLHDSSLCARLIDAGRKAGVRQAFQSAGVEAGSWAPFASRSPRPPWGHPDLVLADAVTAGVLSRSEAQLIGATRLEGLQVKDVAAWLGELPNTVAGRRRRAELRLRRAIQSGDLGLGEILQS
ncbi:hypothetical protein [Actinoplanes friuliensis]|uniref:Uncharacterized protein n=1 Tax=Actinoplanes friuliensis DSM 7358 TaxID=1246995 RepID=U5VYC8_9ACTN|nr:hypothetical protein [Actinoplanes friuliensis]AGZ40715.1 hypothetical protein AFR_12145 [Actinoplanes friuliensis DSM 7358]